LVFIGGVLSARRESSLKESGSLSEFSASESGFARFFDAAAFGFAVVLGFVVFVTFVTAFFATIFDGFLMVVSRWREKVRDQGRWLLTALISGSKSELSTASISNPESTSIIESSIMNLKRLVIEYF
jgi:hypothetical protein